MPHQAVVRQERLTTKLRVVFDVSSSAAGKLSLNDTLSSGMNLNPELIDLLIEFRTHNVVVIADIEKAFLQVMLAEQDRVALGFLRYETIPQQGHHLQSITTWRMSSITFGAKSSPFFLAATLRHHFDLMNEEFPYTSNTLKQHVYVDDLVSGADDLEGAQVLCREATKILEKVGMHLRKWKSNEPRLLSKLKEEGCGQVPLPEQIHQTKVLGVGWEAQADIINFDIEPLIDFLCSREDSKRFLLQATARIFDHMGFLAPTMTTIKMLFQQLWER